jgi:hypothetical protein
MAKRAEGWSAVIRYWWRGWLIKKDKGWYSITLEPSPSLNGRAKVPLMFRRLGEAKKYCETLDTLVDRKSLTADFQLLDQTLCAQAANQMSLDFSRLSIADDLRELVEQWNQS